MSRCSAIYFQHTTEPGPFKQGAWELLSLFSAAERQCLQKTGVGKNWICVSPNGNIKLYIILCVLLFCFQAFPFWLLYLMRNMLNKLFSITVYFCRLPLKGNLWQTHFDLLIRSVLSARMLYSDSVWKRWMNCTIPAPLLSDWVFI